MLTVLPTGLILLEDVRRVGADTGELYAAVRRGELVRVRPGAFVRGDEWNAVDRAGRQRLVVVAASRQLQDPVFSHESAAAVWGMPVFGEPTSVHVTGPWRGGGGSRPGVVRHSATDGTAAVLHDGVYVTPAAATVVALARSTPFTCAVATADYALREGLVTSEALERELPGRSARGTRRARAVIAFADPRAESPGESISRARMHEAGLVAPEQQVRLRDGAGVIGRVDFWWRALRLVGEFDGRIKYRIGGVADRRTLEDRLWDEKVREDRMRDAGLRVVRWTWDDAWEPGRLADRLARFGVSRARPRRQIA